MIHSRPVASVCSMKARRCWLSIALLANCVLMYSDPSGRGSRRRLDALANSLPRQAFIRQARQIGAEDYATRHPSGMNSRLSYRRYYAYLWLISRIIPRQSNQVDWRRLDDACLCYQTDESSREIHYSGEIPLKGMSSRYRSAVGSMHRARCVRQWVGDYCCRSG